MAFELDNTERIPQNRATVKIDSVNGGNMVAGNRLQIRADFGEGIIVLADEIVPAGKIWRDIGFQFQVHEDDV